MQRNLYFLTVLGLLLAWGVTKSATATPVLDGLQMWLDASDMGATPGTIWQDKSGNANNATVTAGSPILVSDTMNGLPVVRFDGDDSYSTPITIASLDPNSNTTFIVSSINNANANQSLLFMGNYDSFSPNWHWWGYSAMLRDNMGELEDKVGFGGYDGNESSVYSQGTLVTNKPFLISGTANSSGKEFWVDGVSQGTVASYSPLINSAAPLRIGQTEGGYDMLYGDIAEILVYDRALSDTERTEVEAYLTDKYALTGDSIEEPTPYTAPLNYSPRGMYMWDTWYQQKGDTTHLFHLQVRRPGSDRPDAEEGTIGHAVSKDLIHWEELPTALYRGAGGEIDSGTLYTGYAIENEGTDYLFYTGNTVVPDAPRIRQSICLATSTDGGATYKKYAGNPILEPDPDLYYSYTDPIAPFPHHAQYMTDCRDIAIVKNPSGDGWLGYVMMRRKGEIDAFHSACIAICRSDDLVNWEVGEPVCTPNRFNCFEVPDVFEQDGKWYMIALTGDVYGQTERWSDPTITCATIVFQADSPEGPFLEVESNLLLASKNNVWQGFSARTVLRNGERLMLYTRCEGTPGRGRLSWPVKLAARPEGGLLPMYWEGCNQAFNAPVESSAMAFSNGESPKTKTLDTIPDDETSYMIRATVNISSGEAGIGFGLDESGNGYHAIFSPSEGPEGLVKLIGPDGTTLTDRQWLISAGKEHQIRLVVIKEMIDIYADDVLLIDYFLADLSPGHLALVGSGNAEFNRILYYNYASQPYESVPGDANGDGKVDGSDVTILAGNWQAGVGDPDTTNITLQMGDFNHDGQVDGSDITILAGNWQYGIATTASTVPEPSSLVSLAFVTVGTVLVLRHLPTLAIEDRGALANCSVRPIRRSNSRIGSNPTSLVNSASLGSTTFGLSKNSKDSCQAD